MKFDESPVSGLLFPYKCCSALTPIRVSFPVQSQHIA